MSGQTSVQESAPNELPTARQLRKVLQEKREILLVYSDGPMATQYQQLAQKMTGKNTYFSIRSIRAEQVSEADKKNSILFLMGSIDSNPVLAELLGQLPLNLSPQKILFADHQFSKKETLFRISAYPNPQNKQLPIYFMTGFDDVQIIQQIEQLYSKDWTSLFWSSWGYQVFEKGRCTLLGSFGQKDWTIDKKVHWDFGNPADTILQTEHFIFIGHQQGFSKKEVTNMAQTCEQTLGEIEVFCNKKVQLPKISFNLYSNTEEKGLMIFNTDQSNVSFVKQEVHSVVNEEFSNNFLQKENELILRNLLDKPAFWFLENGLSLYFTKHWQKEGYQYWAKKLFQSNNEMPLQELLNEQLYQEESHLVKACMSGAFVEFLIHKWGDKKFLENYNNWSPNEKEIQSLNQEWKSYMAQKAPVAARRKKPTLPYWQGFNFAHEGYQVYNGYISKEATRSLGELKDLGSTAIAVVPYTYMDQANEPNFLRLTNHAGSENDESVIHVIHAARKMGIQSLVKPQVWLGHGSWSGFVEMKTQEDWDRFFDYYYRWIRHYAMLSEIHEAEALSVGVEFGKATLGHEEEWKTIFRKLRGIYSGQLTYCANWGEEFEQVNFWKELDFIGLNCYYPLSNSNAPSQKDLQQAFDKILDKVEGIAKRFQKPIIFTEIGFRPVEGTWKNPHAQAGDRAFNEVHQRMCYEVVHQGLADKEWCRGILWWKWPSYLAYGKKNKKGFAPYDLEAEDVVKKWFSERSK